MTTTTNEKPKRMSEFPCAICGKPAWFPMSVELSEYTREAALSRLAEELLPHRACLETHRPNGGAAIFDTAYKFVLACLPPEKPT